MFFFVKYNVYFGEKDKFYIYVIVFDVKLLWSYNYWKVKVILLFNVLFVYFYNVLLIFKYILIFFKFILILYFEFLWLFVYLI